MNNNFILDGMDDNGSLVVDGISGIGSDFTRDSIYKDFFHYTPDVRHGHEEITIRETLSPGDVATNKIRGLGQFGVFRKIMSQQTDLKIRIYIDNEKSMKIAEFEL